MRYVTALIALSLLIISFTASIDMEADGVPIHALETGYASGLPTSGDYNAIAVGDVDGDGNDDMAFGGEDYGSASTQGLYVYKGDGAGNWTSTSTGLPSADSWGGVAFGDADGDGKMELYACNEGWGTDTGSIKGIGAWEYSSGSWSTSGISSPLTTGMTNGLYLGNFTKGSGLDIALTHSSGNTVGIKVYYGSGSSPISWTGNSAGLPTSGEYAGIDVGDLNNDDLPDIAAVAYSGTGLVIYTQNANGNGWTSRSGSLPSSVGTTGLGVVMGDVNNDGDLDIIMGTRDNGMRLLLGNGGGSSGTDFSWTAGSFPSNFGSSGRFAQMDLEDIDHDGDLDLLAGKAGSGLYLFLGNGSDNPGTSFAWTQVTGKGLPTSGTYYGCQFLDVDNDDDLDISGATWGSGIKVYRTNLSWGEVHNSPPMPDAGEDQEVMLGEVVSLDGTGSSDPEDAPNGDTNGDKLSYNWNVSSYPDGSLIRDTSLSPDQFSATPSFTPDIWGTYVLTLAVKDSRNAWSNQSDEDNVTITVIKPDEPPVADAGSDRSVTLGSVVVLNGSKSSDPDGTVEHYNWTCTSHTVVLDDEDSVDPSFTPDLTEVYTFTLKVQDDQGNWSRDEDSVDITVLEPGVNLPPSADAGEDQTVTLGDTAYLNGSGSSDEDGSIVTWEWNCTSHSVILTDGNSSTPSFIPGVAEDHQFTLRVRDDNGSWSAEDTMTVAVEEPYYNVVPIADAGENITITIGETAMLNGSISIDPGGAVDHYNWTCTNHTVSLMDADSAYPWFAPLEVGVYNFTLTVGDNEGAWSDEAYTWLFVEDIPNIPPVADAGENLTVIVGDLVVLDGSGSSDEDGNITEFIWECTSHSVALDDEDTEAPSFTPTVPGTYVFTLQVRDEDGDLSGISTVYVTVEEESVDPLVYPTIGPFLYDDDTPVVGAEIVISMVNATGQDYTATTDEDGNAEFPQGVDVARYFCNVLVDGEEPFDPFLLYVQADGSVLVDGGIPKVEKGSDVPIDDEPPDNKTDKDEDNTTMMIALVLIVLVVLAIIVGLVIFMRTGDDEDFAPPDLMEGDDEEMETEDDLPGDMDDQYLDEEALEPPMEEEMMEGEIEPPAEVLEGELGPEEEPIPGGETPELPDDEGEPEDEDDDPLTE